MKARKMIEKGLKVSFWSRHMRRQTFFWLPRIWKLTKLAHRHHLGFVSGQLLFSSWLKGSFATVCASMSNYTATLGRSLGGGWDHRAFIECTRVAWWDKNATYTRAESNVSEVSFPISKSVYPGNFLEIYLHVQVYWPQHCSPGLLQDRSNSFAANSPFVLDLNSFLAHQRWVVRTSFCSFWERKMFFSSSTNGHSRLWSYKTAL